MKLHDVVDLEGQIALDEGIDEGELRTRDRSIYLAFDPKPEQRDALLTAWLAALRAQLGEPRLGQRLLTAQRILAYALVFFGLMLGAGTAGALLHFEQGGAPINIGHVLLVLVFGQIALLAVLLLSFGLRTLWPRIPLVGDVSRLLRHVTAWIERRFHEQAPASARLDAQRMAYRRLRIRRSLYRTLERYVWLVYSQLFALAFNIGALGACVRLVLLSDLAFAWSTSVAALDAAQVQRVCAILALPFGWLVPDAVPTAALIEHTQYFRLEGRFAGASAGTRGDPQLAAEWWRFLLSSMVTYGLLPRVGTFLLLRRGLKRAEDRVPLDTPAVHRVIARLTTPFLETRAPVLSPQRAEPARAVVSAQPADERRAALVVYRDVPTAPTLLSQQLTRELGLTVVSVHRAGGFDARKDAALLTALSTEATSVCVIAEAWEAPDKSLRNLLAALRDVMGPRRALRVVLIGEAHDAGFAAPASEDVTVFRDRLTLLEDPYLSVETLTALSPSEREGKVHP